MNAANLANSARLKRVLAVLQDGAEHSTFDLINRASVCAINSAVAELRVAGYDVRCRVVAGEAGRAWLYRLVRPEPVQLALVA